MPDTNTNTKLSWAFDAGNYASAYVSEDLQIALDRDSHEGDCYHAYLLGFFSSYELHEIPGDYRDDYITAHYAIGDRMRALGIAVDELDAADVAQYA